MSANPTPIRLQPIRGLMAHLSACCDSWALRYAPSHDKDEPYFVSWSAGADHGQSRAATMDAALDRAEREIRSRGRAVRPIVPPRDSA